MGEQYFGNPEDPDSIGLAELLSRGSGVFVGLNNKETANMMVVDSQTIIQHEQTVLVLKPCLDCLSDTHRIIVGHPTGIGLSLILAKWTPQQDKQHQQQNIALPSTEAPQIM
jgi:hypothetical protein